MLTLPASVRIYVALDPVDLRTAVRRKRYGRRTAGVCGR